VWGLAARGITVPRILVADDNTNIQKMVVLAFQERGVEVIAVGNGEAAVRRLPDANPDLVLADVFMPVRNGYEVCEFVKKDPRFAHVPVILLVGAFDPLDEKEARQSVLERIQSAESACCSENSGGRRDRRRR
jgi:CheY-like chemotaxis protein